LPRLAHIFRLDFSQYALEYNSDGYNSPYIPVKEEEIEEDPLPKNSTLVRIKDTYFCITIS